MISTLDSTLERLRALRAGKSLDSPFLIGLDDLPIDRWYEFEERAAIREYEGGLSREQANREVLAEIVERIRKMKKIKKYRFSV